MILFYRMESLKCQGLWLLVLLILATSEQVKADHPSTLEKQPKCFGISRGKTFILGFTDNLVETGFNDTHLSIVVVAFRGRSQLSTFSRAYKPYAGGRGFMPAVRFIKYFWCRSFFWPGRCARTKISNAPGQKCCAWTNSSSARTKNIAPGQNISKNTRDEHKPLFSALHHLPLCTIIVCSDWYPIVGYFVTAFRVHFSLCRRASWLHFDNSVVFRLGSKSVIVR